jgi:hypothetical protein
VLATASDGGEVVFVEEVGDIIGGGEGLVGER